MRYLENFRVIDSHCYFNWDEPLTGIPAKTNRPAGYAIHYGESGSEIMLVWDGFFWIDLSGETWVSIDEEMQILFPLHKKAA